MIDIVRRNTSKIQIQEILVILAVLSASLIFGAVASLKLLILIIVAVGIIILLLQPAVGLIFIVLSAIIVRFEIATGTDVFLNTATILVPVLVFVVLISLIRKRQIHLVRSRTNIPLALFLLSSLLSLFIGHVIWDPGVPRDNNFTLVQLAQWAIFALSAFAFWLSANVIRGERWLKWFTASFLIVAGSVAIFYVFPFTAGFANRMTTEATTRAAFWVLLAGLSGGQLMFNRDLSINHRIILLFVLISCLVYAVIIQRASVSLWIGIGVTLAVLIWLRWPRMRWVSVIAMMFLIFSGVFYETLWSLAGGQIEWQASGAPRLLLIERVIEVTMRNPITGLGPAAYHRYTSMTPLSYGRALWVQPQISSHNNYIDILSQTGLLGLGIFLWFVVELIILGVRLIRQKQSGFAAGYTHGMLAVVIGALVIMLLADWILPFVYNIGFPGFQASILVWLFMGGLVALERLGQQD